MFKPRADPCIFLHSSPDDWLLLLGERLSGELVRRFRHLARDVDDLVQLVADNPGILWVGLRGLEVGGPFRNEWTLFVEGGYVAPHARARWLYVETGERLDVRVQVSPCFLLSSLDKPGVRYTWRNRASTIFRWVSEVPRLQPLEVFRRAFPAELRELAHSRGYAWVAWTRWRDRRNRHLAEWLYWLDTGRLAHIDALLGRMCTSPSCTKNPSSEGLYISAL
ncbi:hypothetical protein [Pyrobaculum neutrophilum]|uniref:Uncharacterized protein n=1 Tax=Pyrobaculum neutrophilum (strain DSM 2338 / JCM 9278 / NBRC 100436 / V24Sta) TaxID=444157 RepID=B1Y8S4_PYRNV|nr:hypothetical protein [Pyrobaculum neutrophilum]ACB40153.1 conserved hypothetical protein [Pyrobaculum neutrophilum V24Sta]